MVRFLLVLALHFVISRSPVTLLHGLCGPLLECLPEKFRTTPVPVDPVLVATGFRHGSNPTKLLYLGCIAVSITLGAEGRDETRSDRGTGSRQRSEDLEIGMRLGQLLDLLIVILDGLA